MSPIPDMKWEEHEVVPKPTDPEELILEAWAQGYLVGALVIMSFITLANMRRGVLLHKVSSKTHTRNGHLLTFFPLPQLILLEVSPLLPRPLIPMLTLASSSSVYGKASGCSSQTPCMPGGCLLPPSS